MKRVKNAFRSLENYNIDYEDAYLFLGSSSIKEGNKKCRYLISALCTHCFIGIECSPNFIGIKKKKDLFDNLSNPHKLECTKNKIIFSCPAHGGKYVVEDRKKINKGFENLKKENKRISESSK